MLGANKINRISHPSARMCNTNATGDPDAIAPPYANYVPKSACHVNEKSNTANYQNDKELLRDIALLANSMIPLHTLQEMRNHMQPRARVKWDRYLAKAVEMSTQIEEEYARKLGPSSNIVPDLTVFRKSEEEMNKLLDTLRETTEEQEQESPLKEFFPDSNNENGQQQQQSYPNERTTLYDKLKVDDVPPEFVDILNRFLAIASEKKIINVNDLDGEQTWAQVKELELDRATANESDLDELALIRKRIENEERAKNPDGNEEESDYDSDDISRENLSSVKYDKPIRDRIDTMVSELGTLKNFDAEQDMKDGLYDEIIKIANEKDEEGDDDDGQIDILAKNVEEDNNDDDDYDEVETDSDKIQFSNGPQMTKLTDKNLLEEEGGGNNNNNFRGGGDGKEVLEDEGEEENSEMYLQDQHYPLGHAWQVKWKPAEDEEEETETQLANWWELEDAVLVFFEDEEVQSTTNIVNRNEGVLFQTDERADLVDQFERKAREPESVAMEINKIRQGGEVNLLEKSAKFAEIEKKFLESNPHAKPLSIDAFIKSVSEPDDDDYDHDSDYVDKLRIQMRRRIEQDGVEAYLPYLYIIEHWRAHAEPDPDNLELLTKTMDPNQRRLFLKNQNGILHQIVSKLYESRPDVYQYFTTRLTIPPYSLRDPPELQEYIINMESRYPIVYPETSYEASLAGIIATHPTFLPSISSTLLRDDEEMRNIYDSELTFLTSPESLKLISNELSESNTNTGNKIDESIVPETSKYCIPLTKKQKKYHKMIMNKVKELLPVNPYNEKKVLNIFENVAFNSSGSKNLGEFDLENLGGIEGGEEEGEDSTSDIDKFGRLFTKANDIALEKQAKRDAELEKEYEEREKASKSGDLSLANNRGRRDNEDDDEFDEEYDLEGGKFNENEIVRENEEISREEELDVMHDEKGLEDANYPKVKRRIAIISFELKQIYLSELECVMEDQSGHPMKSSPQAIHNHRLVDIPPKWLQLFKSVKWPDNSKLLVHQVSHMPTSMVFESKLGENDELRRLSRQAGVVSNRE